jgi:hypothetical protein
MNQENDLYKSHYVDILKHYKPTTFSNIPENVAVCIETRFLPIMYIIILQMQRFLPSNWKIILNVSSNVINEYKELLKGCSVEITPLTHHITSVSTYNKFMMTKEFWTQFIKYNRVLIFQSDTMMYRYGIEKFIKYDYVGAPWPNEMKLKCIVGNGGFSLRNPRACIECLNHIKEIKIPVYMNHDADLKKLDNVYPEDVFYSQAMEQLGFNVCHEQIAQYFSVETCKLNTQTIASHNLTAFVPKLYTILYRNSVIPYNVTYRDPKTAGHRFGWKFVYDNMKVVFNNPTGVQFNTWTDCDYNTNYKKNNNTPWVGITHFTPIKWMEYYKDSDINLLLSNNDFINDLKSCLGLFTLSAYMKPKLEEILNILGFDHIRVCNLYHPIEFIEPLYSLENIKKVNNLVAIGCQLRRLTTIFKVKTSYNKIWLPGRNIIQVRNLLLKDCESNNITLNKEEINKVSIRMLDNKEFDNLLLNSFVLIDLYDASANNALIECISRNIICFVRRLPAVEEYIGKEYPLLFDSIEELEMKLHNYKLIKKAYNYLVSHNEFKEQLKINRFISDILNSDITKYILSH